MRILQYMTKPVTLSDSAFAALRKEKKQGESDSDVVLRLLETARASQKDPWRFVRDSKHWKRSIPLEEMHDWIRAGRAADRRDAWAEARKRNKGVGPARR